MSQILFNSSGDLLSKFVHDMYSQSVLVALHVFSIPFSARLGFDRHFDEVLRPDQKYLQLPHFFAFYRIGRHRTEA